MTVNGIEKEKLSENERKNRTLRIISLILVCLAVIFNLVFLYPETLINTRSVNDSVFHFSASLRMSQALTSGENPLDAWVDTFSLGYPIWRSYQPFAHFVTAVVFRLAKPLLAPRTVFIFINYILLCFLPLCFYIFARAAGLGLIGGGFAAALSLTISSGGLFGDFGIGFGAFVWRGSGLYAELWGLALMLVSLTYFLRAVRKGKGLPIAGLFLALTCLSHIMIGYIAMVSAFLFVLVGYGNVEIPFLKRVFRAFISFFVTLILISFFIVPLWMDRDYINHSRWEDSWKWDSFGAEMILQELVRGSLFDADRLPVLTILIGAGLLIAALQARRNRSSRALIVLFGFWLLIFFGRTTWGHLLKLLLVSEDMHLHRFQTGYQVFALLLAAYAVETLFLRFKPWKSGQRVVLSSLVIAIILVPMYRERVDYLRQNTEWGMENLKAYEAEKEDLESLLERVEELTAETPGRIHAGRAAGWGNEFKIGHTTVYTFLAEKLLPSTSFLYHAMSIGSETMVLINENRSGDLALFGVRYLLASDIMSAPWFVQHVETAGRFSLYEVPDSGYFDIISVPYAFEGNRKTFYEPSEAWLEHPLRKAGQYIALYTGKAPPGIYKKVLHRWETLPKPAEENSPPQGRVEQITRDGDQYKASVHTGGPCHVLFKCSFHPGLQVLVDGKEVTPVMVTPGLTAIPVTAGSHEITVSYSAGLLKPVLFLLGILAACLAGIASQRGYLRSMEEELLPKTKKLWYALKNSRFTVMRNLVSGSRKHGIFIIILIFISLIALRPCYRGRLMDGHDATAYPPRVVEYHENIRSGIFFPIWAPDLSNGYGQPLFSFEPPLFYSLAEFFYAAGTGLADTIQFSALLLGIFAALSMYGMGCSLGSRKAGLIMATAYLFSCYFQLDLYVRANFMEFTAISVFPFTLWMLFRVLDDRSRLQIPLACLGIALLMLSHNAIALVGMVVLGIFGLILSGKSVRKLAKVVISIITGLALSAFFWVPALWEKEYIQIEKIRESFLHYSNHFVSPLQLFYSPWDYGLSLPGSDDKMSFMLGPIHLILAIIGVVVLFGRKKRGSVNKRFALAAILVTLIAVWLSTAYSKPFWSMIPILQYFQFPWRFLFVPAVMLSLLSGCWLLNNNGENQTRLNILAAMAILALALTNLSHVQPSQFLIFDDEYYAPESVARKGINTTTREEYEPKWVVNRPAYTTRKLDPVTCEGEFSVTVLPGGSPNFREFSVNVQSSCKARLNTFYYPGWEIYVDGEKVPVTVEQKTGRMLFHIPEGVHDVSARLTNTPLRAASRRVSFITAVILIVFVLISCFMKRLPDTKKSINVK